MSKNVTLGDFKPINNWEPEVGGPKWSEFDNSKEDIPVNLIDQSTGRKYLNESKG